MIRSKSDSGVRLGEIPPWLAGTMTVAAGELRAVNRGTVTGTSSPLVSDGENLDA